MDGWDRWEMFPRWDFAEPKPGKAAQAGDQGKGFRGPSLGIAEALESAPQWSLPCGDQITHERSHVYQGRSTAQPRDDDGVKLVRNTTGVLSDDTYPSDVDSASLSDNESEGPSNCGMELVFPEGFDDAEAAAEERRRDDRDREGPSPRALRRRRIRREKEARARRRRRAIVVALSAVPLLAASAALVAVMTSRASSDGDGVGDTARASGLEVAATDDVNDAEVEVETEGPTSYAPTLAPVMLDALKFEIDTPTILAPAPAPSMSETIAAPLPLPMASEDSRDELVSNPTEPAEAVGAPYDFTDVLDALPEDSEAAEDSVVPEDAVPEAVVVETVVPEVGDADVELWLFLTPNPSAPLPADIEAPPAPPTDPPTNPPAGAPTGYCVPGGQPCPKGTKKDGVKCCSKRCVKDGDSEERTCAPTSGSGKGPKGPSVLKGDDKGKEACSAAGEACPNGTRKGCCSEKCSKGRENRVCL